jgi:hypothetical protein
MQGSQLLDLMKSLTKHDMRELRKVVCSPYFNQRKDVIQLFDFIEKSLNNKTPNFVKEHVFSILFPSKKYEDATMRQMMSYLLKTIEKYLITEGVLANKLSSQFYIIDAFKKRNSDKLFEKQLKDCLNEIDNSEYKNAKYHYFKYQISVEEHDYRGKKKREADLSLQSVSNELDFFYISERLRIACLMFAHQTVSKNNYNQPLLNFTLEQVGFMQSPPLSVLAYYHTYKALSEPDNELHFKELKKIIIDSGHFFTENERRDLYVLATNYCIGRLNRGIKEYGKEALELYRARLDNNVLLENGILPPYTYRNILTAALKAEEYDWAERVLYDFKQYLPEKERENIFNYNLAIFYFRTGKYPDAMMLLQKVNLNDVLYNLDARRLLARIYYETHEDNALHSLIESSKVYLHRQKDIGYHHDMYANYFRFLERMMKIDLKKAESRKILRGEVEGTQLLAEREWLMERLK